MVAITKNISLESHGQARTEYALRKLNGNAKPRSLGIPELYTGVMRGFSRSADTGAVIERIIVKNRSEAIL